MSDLGADLVLEGGGVKGIAHVGALSVLAERGYRFHRVAGTSVGAVVAAFVAAGVSIERMERLMRPGADPDSIDYRRVAGARRLPILGWIEDAASLLFGKGLHDSRYLHEFIETTLQRETGGRITRFGDLRIDDGRADLADNQRYRLVAMVTDVSRGSLVRVPWDLGVYGYTAADRDAMPVADAVRASAAIPFFFKPVRFPWKEPPNISYWVDGAAVSDFPIEVFDRTDGHPPRWPTFGIKLSVRPRPDQLLNRISGTLSFAEGLFETVVNGNDQVHLADPCVVDRTIFVDTTPVAATDFELPPDQQRLLFERGRQAATAFLAEWDWDAHRRRCPARPERLARAAAARGERPRMGV